MADGAQISFTEMLKTRIQEFVKLHNEVDWSKEKNSDLYSRGWSKNDKELKFHIAFLLEITHLPS